MLGAIAMGPNGCSGGSLAHDGWRRGSMRRERKHHTNRAVRKAWSGDLDSGRRT